MVNRSGLALGKTAPWLFTTVLFSIIAGAVAVALPMAFSMLLALALVGGIASLALVLTGGLRRLSVAALMGFAILLPMTGLRLSASLSISDLLLLTAAVSLLPLLLTRLNSVRVPPFRYLLGGSACILIGALVGSSFSANVAESIFRLGKLGLAALVLPLLICVLAPSISEVRHLAISYVGGSLISCLVAIVEPLQSYNQRADGLANHFNSLGLTSVLAVGVSFVYTVTKRGPTRMLGFLTTLTLVVGISLSGSRAAGIGTLVTVLAALWLLSKTRIAVAVALGSVAMLTALSNGVVNVPGSGPLARVLSLRASNVQLSNSGRVELIQESVSRILQNPFLGTGLVDARAAHNLYLQIWQSSGLLGLLGVSLILFASVVIPARTIRASANEANPEHLLLIGITSSAVGFFIADLFQNAFWERYIWFILALSAALLRSILDLNLGIADACPGRGSARPRRVSGARRIPAV